MVIAEKTGKFLDFIEKILLGAGFSLIVLGALFRFISRNMLTSAIAIETSDFISGVLPHLILLMGFIGASAGIARGEIIKIDLVKNLLPAKFDRFFLVLNYLLTAALLLFFIYLGIKLLEFGDSQWILLGYIPALVLIIARIVLAIIKK